MQGLQAMQEDVRSLHSSYDMMQRQLQQLPSLPSSTPTSFFGGTTHGSQTSEHPPVHEDDPLTIFFATHDNAEHPCPMPPPLAPSSVFPRFNQHATMSSQDTLPFMDLGTDNGSNGVSSAGVAEGRTMLETESKEAVLGCLPDLLCKGN